MSDKPEDVLDKADALIRRHRSFVAGPAPAAPDDDFPVLTDEVSLDNGAAAALDETTVQHRLRETLSRLEPDIAHAVETWLMTELPQIVAREMGSLAPRIVQAANRSLQEALLPEIARLVLSADEHTPAQDDT